MKQLFSLLCFFCISHFAYNQITISSSTVIDPICLGDCDGSIQITVSGGTPPYNYAWQDASGGLIGTNAPTISNLCAGNYNVTVIDATLGGNPPATQAFTLTAQNSPVIDAGADQTVCPGTSATLNAVITSQNPGAISWDNGVVQNTPFIPNGTQTYTATVTETASGCTATDQVTVTVDLLPEVEVTPDVRSGCSPLTVNFSSNTTNSISCDWLFSDGQFSTGCGNKTVVFDNFGCVDLEVTATSLNGCVAIIDFPAIVCVTDGPIAAFTPSPAVLNPETPTSIMQNTSTGATQYFWDFGDGTTSTASSPSHDYEIGASGVYTVVLTATDDGGCESRATAIITIEEELLYYVPNSFTPNGNEFNQLFLPVFTSGFDIYDYNFTVFNRWGDRLFESNDHLVGWDGSKNGESPVEGTYTWRIEFRRSESDERVLVVGHVNLLKQLTHLERFAYF